MTNPDISIHPVVHIILHVQRDYLTSFPPSYLDEYIGHLDASAESFRQRNVPVILVIEDEHHDPFMVFVDEAKELPPPVLQADLKVGNKPGDVICVAAKEHPFDIPAFEDLLKVWCTKTVILSGLKSSDCVASAVAAALDRGFAVKVASDGLADPNSIPEPEDEPEDNIFVQEEALYENDEFYRVCESPKFQSSTYQKIFDSMDQERRDRTARIRPFRRHVRKNYG
jgi:nicotinamidase-related amidase